MRSNSLPFRTRTCRFHVRRTLCRRQRRVPSYRPVSTVQGVVSVAAHDLAIATLASQRAGKVVAENFVGALPRPLDVFNFGIRNAPDVYAPGQV